ncbi:McrC family protein [Vulcanisaeta sp. JCM 14467]|uniref:McrC family protein n=1 Tax=Vulcanisaeta sp. JCM 14467 TaxID=1295370 RepID=UPI000AB99F12|nr:McrC family protein [Vulcanisaeta sp. JCM 14467]
MSETIEIGMREWEERTLPEELVSDKEFLNRLLNLFDRRNNKVFDAILRLDGKVAIKARGYVGIFALKDSRDRDIILIVEPKIGIKNLVWMLAISEAKNFKEVREIENLISIPSNGQSVIDLLVIGIVRRYLEKLSEAIMYGFLEMPKIEVEEGTVIRGRILSSLIPKTLFSNPSPRVAYEIQYYTVDNPINQYILDTGYMLYLRARYLLKIIDKDPGIIFKAMLELDYSPFSLVRDVNIHDLLSIVPLDRPYINELLRLAVIIRKWLEYEQPPRLREFIRVPALYINMNNLFENFVRKMMTIAAKWLRRTKGIKIVVRKAGEKEQALVTAPRPKVYLEPDIVIEVDGKPVAVGDVKYKLVKDPLKSGPEGDRDAVYQVYTYMHGWDVNKGFIVYPSIKDTSSYVPYLLNDGKKLYIIKIHIDKVARSFKELRSSELFNKLLKFLEELIK